MQNPGIYRPQRWSHPSLHLFTMTTKDCVLCSLCSLDKLWKHQASHPPYTSYSQWPCAAWYFSSAMLHGANCHLDWRAILTFKKLASKHAITGIMIMHLSKVRTNGRFISLSQRVCFHKVCLNLHRTASLCRRQSRWRTAHISVRRSVAGLAWGILVAPSGRKSSELRFVASWTEDTGGT